MNRINKVLGGVWVMSLLAGSSVFAGNVGADTLYITNQIVPVNNMVLIGYAASGASQGVVVGNNATGTFYGISVGAGANGDNVGTAIGVWNFATNWGCAVGYRNNGSSYGIALGNFSYAVGMGNVAIGGTTWTNGIAISPAMVPSNWTDTVELGRGTATLPGGLSFRGYGIVNSNGMVVAPFSASNLVVTGGLTLTNGNLNLSGATISGLSASQITNGHLSVSVLPTGTNGFWDAGGMVVSNLTLGGVSGGVTQNLQQVLLTGNDGHNQTITNVILTGVQVYGDGLGLTNLNASKITTGTLGSAFLPATGGWNAGNLTVSNLTIIGGMATNLIIGGGLTVSNLTITGSFTGNGAGITNISGAGLANLNASMITTGTLAAAYLPSSGGWNAGSLTATNLTIIGGTASNLTFTGILTGNGAGLTNLSGAGLTGLNANQITGGILMSSVMPTGGTWNAGGMTVNNLNIGGGSSGGAQSLEQVLTVGSNGNGRILANVVLTNVVIYGDGTGLTNIPGTALTSLSANQITGGTLAAGVLPTTGNWNPTSLQIAWGVGNTPTLGQVLSAGNNGGNLVLSNVVIYGSGAGLTGVMASNVIGLGSAAISDSTNFAGVGHTHDASQIVAGRLTPDRLPTNGTWDAGTMLVSNLTIVGYSGGTILSTNTDGGFTNLTVSGCATVSNLTVTGQATLQYVPEQGDLSMGMFTNLPAQ